MKGIMLQGTSSDVGKSVLATAFCRILSQLGYRVAPFKSQNMSNNSYVTDDAREIGRAQGVQAEACGIKATVHMNPILLKPRSDQTSEVVLLGKSFKTYSGSDYRSRFYQKGCEVINESLAILSQAYDLVVIEGAGSPVEINLNDRELVNMRVAEMADVPVFLIADIERGGVFASIVGTLELLQPEHRERVKGIIINKFRGDIALFESGVTWLEERTGIKIVGVVPHLDNLKIEGEDALSMTAKFETAGSKPLDIAVIRLPHVSNFTDIEPFLYEDEVSVRFVETLDQFGHPDAVIIPGTRSTINDLRLLKARKLDRRIIHYADQGGWIIGLCGGYQMLSKRIADKAGTDTGLAGNEISGLGLLPMTTTFFAEKTTVKSKGQLHPLTGLQGIVIKGFEIHLGATSFDKNCQGVVPFICHNDGSEEGAYARDGRIIGSYFHDLFYNDDWRNHWLNNIRKEKGISPKQVTVQNQREAGYDRLASQIRQALDIDYVVKVMEDWQKEREHRCGS
ncbi:adenosylcobyric acid synthase (glutamine-hydrolysing) [Scopulibacillus darangshiensis]|uniref:Cobyric acid synthase n=1 Tax=Scopulibacillus darangshiensis TaxID=442528 RepID=A0A4V2SNI3_9BACL|nr:cobyric acid synthase [Scopulibacillus darangshiensis]TCP31256.1 adenosylcobyric acid synthase (glutamine-hydrolysing) [Scopulibacillus darangshiensis]